MKRLGAALACWLGIGLVFGTVELLVWAYRHQEVFLYSHRLGAFTLARHLFGALGSRPPWLVSGEHLWVPSVPNLIVFLSDGLLLYGTLAVLGGLGMWLLLLPLSRFFSDATDAAVHSAAATLAFGGATIALKPLQGMNDYVVSHLATGWRGFFLAILAVCILAAATFLLSRFVLVRRRRSTLRLLGGVGGALWLGAATVMIAQSFSGTGEAEPGWAAGPEASDSDRRHNVVLISIDTLRADHLSSYGYDRPTSPNLDRLAAGGVLFEQCISAAPWTIPSHISLFTSKYPSEHGVWDNFSRLQEGAPTLAEIFSAAGYATLGVVSALNVSSLYGFDVGFDVFDDHESELRNAELVTDRAIELVDEHEPGPFFLFAHYFDPHTTYAPPEPYASMFAGERPTDSPDPTFDGLLPSARHDVSIADADLDWIVGLYDGEIRYADEQVGRLLDHLQSVGLSDNTVVAVVSDHGQEFKEHGSLFHRATLYEEVVRVPCIYSSPDGPQGVRVASTVRTIDVPPTLLELAGLEAPPEFRGRALAAAVAAGAVEPLSAMSETTEHLQRKALIQDGFKLILSPYYEPTLELYRLSDDPLERRNVAASHPNETARLKGELYRLFEQAIARRRAGSPATAVELEDEQLQQLRSLGYLQ